MLKQKQENIFMLWQNKNSIIIGKSQNTLAEINYEKVKSLSVNVVRRLTGGGAVYHDLGNLNYTFITNTDGTDFLNFEKFSFPIVQALKTIGIKAVLSGRNDLLINDKKFSGNAQCVFKNRILHHGTMMFNTDISILNELLNVNCEKIKSKGITSVKSRVTNIIDNLDNKSIDILELRDIIKEHVLSTFKNSIEYDLTDNDLTAINKLKTSVYDTWDWNFGYSPKYSFSKTTKLKCGLINASLDIKDGIIVAATITGDFFSHNDIHELEKMLCGIKHNEDDLTSFYNTNDLALYFGHISCTEFITCII